jgi:hypothetical protein
VPTDAILDDINDETLQTALGMLARRRTSDEIAKFLVDESCQGARQQPFTCPVARYLRRWFGARPGYRFSVDGLKASAYQERPRHEAVGDWMELDIVATADSPLSVRGFVVNFDNGVYPYLCA